MQVDGMPAPLSGLKAVVRDDAVSHVVGGYDGFRPLSSTEPTDMYVAGEFDDFATVSSVELYDIEARQWYLAPYLRVPLSTSWISHDVPDPEYWLSE
ncbi:hypothetical protein HPB48_002836 [Haemaphysalis longicornis]|uniref:Kelch repeat protein n=1 Tax=Haemaphysalis longicornis TaxID=44386 RepID=A0A9J6FCR8_HAELO|nr:hypothetical protein HPB48_002836 [Haemaphysalis longicornis]